MPRSTHSASLWRPLIRATKIAAAVLLLATALVSCGSGDPEDEVATGAEDSNLVSVVDSVAQIAPVAAATVDAPTIPTSVFVAATSDAPASASSEPVEASATDVADATSDAAGAQSEDSGEEASSSGETSSADESPAPTVESPTDKPTDTDAAAETDDPDTGGFEAPASVMTSDETAADGSASEAATAVPTAASTGASGDAIVAPTATSTGSSDGATNAEPTAAPSAAATAVPTAVPTVAPTPVPTVAPTAVPVAGSGGCNAPLASGDQQINFNFGGNSRVIHLYVPGSYNPAVETPLILTFHGFTSDGASQLSNGGFRNLAESQGVIVAAPTSLPNSRGLNSWQISPSFRNDVSFANAVLDKVIDTACVDESRVYAMGWSNGGYFTSVLLCNMSHRLAAAASVGGLTYEYACAPGRSVPYIGFHGTADPSVSYSGDGQSSLRGSLGGVPIPQLMSRAIPDEFGRFAAAYGCGGAPSESPAGGGMTRFSYSGCGVEMTFYRVDGGGHTWPGSATSIAWSMFSQYSR